MNRRPPPHVSEHPRPLIRSSSAGGAGAGGGGFAFRWIQEKAHRSVPSVWVSLILVFIYSLLCLVRPSNNLFVIIYHYKQKVRNVLTHPPKKHDLASSCINRTMSSARTSHQCHSPGRFLSRTHRAHALPAGPRTVLEGDDLPPQRVAGLLPGVEAQTTIGLGIGWGGW